MYRIGKKVSIGILCALFALVLTLVAVFALAPNTSTAHAETEYTVVWDQNVIKALPEYDYNTELASIADAASSRTITMKSVNGYIYHSYNYDYDDPVYEYSELHNSSVATGFTFTISNPSETTVTYFTKVEIKGGGASLYDTPTGSGWTENDSGLTWNGSALTVNFDVDGYVSELSEIKYTFKIVDGFVTTLNTNGGTINSGNVTFYETGVGATLPTDVTKNGYGFKGWYGNATFEGDPVTAIGTDATGDKEFWAKWLPTVTLNTNDGVINSGEITEYIEGVGATLPTDVTKENCTFGGWYDNATFDGDPVTAIGTEATGGKTYWAKWICTVTLNTNGGTINSGDVTEYAEGVGATLPTDVTKEDAFFAGWYDNASFDGDPVTTIGTNDRGPKEYWAKYLDHIHEYSSAWSYDDSKHWHACTSTKGVCDAPIIDEEEHSLDESLDTTAYYKCKCGYEDAERKNTFYNTTVYLLDIDTNLSKKTYTKRNITVTVNIEGDEDGAGIIFENNRMTITVTGNVVLTDIWFEIGDFYDMNHDNFRISSGHVYSNYSTDNDTGMIKTEYIYTKKVYAYTTDGWLHIKHLKISTMAVNAVTYELDGGSFNGEYIDYYRTHYGLTLPTNVSKSGYVFKGWYNNENFEGDPIPAITDSDTGNKTFYAKWNRPITYNVNGGAFDGEYPTDYAPGVGATLPTNIAKDGYAFGGWYDNADFEGAPITTITTEDTDEKTYWAKWYPIGYHLIGSMTDWKVDEKYLLTKNTAVTDIDEYYIELSIAAGAQFKVVHGNAVYGEEGVKNTWYPDGTDNSYTVSENGFYRVYFRPDGNGESDWHENVLLAKRLFAQVNGTNYHTIADAYAVVTAGGTIKLVDDLDLSGATDCLDVTKNVTIDLNGFILDITTSTEPKIAVNGGAVITIDDSSDDIGGVKGAFGVDSENGSYIVLKNCRLSLDATAVRLDWRITNTATGYVVRSIEDAPDADGFVTIVRQGTDQEIADDVVELIDAIGTVEATTTSKQKINDARERYDALTTEQQELVAEDKLTTLEEAEAQYIQLLVATINALPAVGSLVFEDRSDVQNARALYEMLTDTEKTAFSAEALAKLQAAEVDIADCEAAKAVENRIEALPSTILFEHSDDVARVRVVYDALTNYQKGKVPTATYNKLSAAEAVIAEWKVAMMVTAQIEGLPAAEEITIDNKTRIESARAKYDALTGTVKDKVTAETVSKLEAAENAWAAMKAASDAADVVEAAIAAIGKLERSEACQQKIADAREQYNNLTDLQKSLVDNYSTLVYAENKYAAYVAAADAVIGKINAIGTVENTEASKEKIDEARAAFNALLTEEKEFVTNYDVLAAAESAYAAFTPSENVAEIGETKYTTVLEALTAAKKGETVKLLTDIDLSDKEKAYITLRRDITIDLNGHELNVTSASLTYIIWASDGAVITIDNSVPEQGGIKGLLGADYLSGAKIVLINCRLTVSVVEFSEYDAFLSIGDDCVMKDLNSGKMSVVGYVSIVRPIGDQDLADDVIDLIKAIKAIELTDECNALIIAAREGYDALTDGQKALVENFSVLTSAESAYAALATAKFEALPAADAITIADKLDVETARAIYDSLTDAEKAYVPAEAVTKLTDAEAALAVILEDYILAGDDCTHRSVEIIDVYVSTTALTQSSYSNPDIQNGHEGIKIRFPRSQYYRTTEGTARVTVKIALAEAHEVEIWWKFDYEAIKHTCSLKYTHDAENWVSAPTNAEWKVDRIYLEAGTYTFQYQCSIGRKNPLSSEYKDRYFYVVPMFFPSFDDNSICTLCGTECLHETVSVAYDAEKNDYHFVCKDSCFKTTIDLNAISFDQETSFETARAAYDALTDEQKAMFRPSDLFKLEAHEMKVAEIEAEQNAVNDEKTAFKVTELINGLPQTDEVTLTDYVVIQETRAAYEALTAKQKTYVTTATLARLTDVEEKYTQIKANADAEEKDAVIALINALPVGDAITFEKRSLIEQAGVAYNMLTSAQKGQITTETKNVLSAAELRGVIVSWEDFFPEDGTYILVSATDDTKAIVRIDKDTIQIGTYGDMDVNDPDVATANNRDFKWKIVSQGENAFYTLINIFYTGANERLLDVGSWEEQLGDGSNLGLVVTDAAKGEHETNVFRFSKRKGVDMEEDEYYIRAVSTLCDKYNFTITLRTGDSVNIGTYVAKNGGQVWKLVRVKGDEEFAKEVIDRIAALPTYDDTVLDNESDIVAVREAYTALNEYQKTLVSNLDYLVSAEQKIVDIKAANAVDAEITAIGTVEDTAASKAKVDEVRAAYNAITDAQRLLVTKLETLVAAETACADFVTAAIEAIPASAEITINNITAINAARAKYEALTPEEKTHVTQATIDKLSAAEVTITVISLPAVGVLTLENKSAVVAARAEYTALTAGAKEVFGVLETLVAAETEIADIEAAKAVTDAITALPEIANITVGDSDDVMEVVTAYNALSPYQQGKVPADKVNKLFAEKMSIVILALPAYDDITLEHETVVNDAYDAYLALPDDQRQLMLADVTTKITSEKKKIDDMNAAKAVTNLIEAIGEVEYTDESKDKIDTARIQYNGLTDEQKAFVTAETLTILTDAEKEYADAANEAIYAKLSKDIDELTDEDKEYIAEAKATYDDLTDEEKDLIPQGTKDKLFASVTTIAVLEIPDADEIDEDITDEKADAIKAAKEMYDDLTPEQQALMPEDAVNKVLASAVTLDIVELTDTDEITIDDKTDILAAKEAFDALTPEQQDLIPQTKKDVLEASVTTVAIVEIPVANDIDEDITDEEANKIKAAKEMYDDLTPEQQALVPEEVVNKVFASDTVLTIVELTDTDEITANDKEAIEAARAKYDSLTGDQKDLIPSDIVDTLIASEAVLDIVELPVGTDITTEDKTDIQAARAAYNVLTPEQKEKVTQDTVNTLIAAEAILDIVELPVGLDISEDDEDEIVAAREAFDKLTEDQKKKVPQDTVDTLVAAEAVLTIVELPTITLIKAEDEDEIVAAREAYDKLTDDQKKKVPQDTVDTLAASESTLVIVKLPDEEELKADDKDAIVAARAAYEKLTDEQKENVPQASKDKLIASEVVLEIIELTDTDEISPEDEEAIVAARAAYEELSEKQKYRVPKDIVDTLCASEAILDIVELPVGLDISEDDEDSIVAAREAYDKLTEDQKKKVPQDTVDTLCAAEAVLGIVELPVGTDISEDDEDEIVAAREAYDKLTEDQKKKVPQDTVDTLCAAETVLTIVELPVVGELTLEDKSDVEAARAAYDKLSDDQKKKVPQDTVDALVAAETEIADIEAAKETTDAIVALPSSAETTREDREDVVATREAYDKLTPYQQSKVPEETVAKLVAAEEIFVALDKIDAIGEVAYTPETKALIDSAKESYDGLSDEQKEAITNADKLQKADTDYNAVDEVVTKIEAITDIRYDERSGSAIEGARQEYSTLTTDQQAMLFASSYQKLVDAEMVYETLGKIDAIGKVEYSEESKDLIDEAREYYDALSDEQKALINVQDVETLTVSEQTYTEKDNGAKATYTALLVIVGVLLAAGLLVLAGMVYLQLKGKKKKGTKTFSVFFLPLLLGATHYIDSPFIALYVLAAVTLIVFVAIIVLAVKNPNLIKGLKTIFKKENKEEKVSEQEEKKAEPVAPIVVQEAPKQETPVAVATTAEEVSLAQDEGDEDGGVVVDAKGNYFNIRYNKSFTAKLIQSSDETKGYYGELKNEILSYAKAKSRVSWAYDSVNAGREAVAKFGVRGKTLCLYLPLKAEELDEKYKVEAIESAKYAAVPCMYRIKNERRLRYAKELIATACNALGLEKGETKGENYYLPFESTEALVKKNLVKELTVAATSTQIEKAKTEGTIRIVESVSATEVNDLISTEIAAAAITESDTHATGKKGIVNVDTLSRQYNAGDTVTVESLHEKKLIAPGVKQVKLLARGVLDKKLHVELQDYSIEAVKMILATGGTVKKA